MTPIPNRTKAKEAAGKEEGKQDAADDAGSVIGGAPPLEMGAKEMAEKDGDGAKHKKREADEPELPKEPDAKRREEKPAEPERPKASVDVETQCGVQLPNGALCARSLTCKSHSMGAKRVVLGRSQPYDILLATYQKKNQAKITRAASDTGAPPRGEAEAAL